jgi:hypothetical protein
MSNAIHRVTHRGRRLRWRRLHRRLHEHLDLIAKFASLALIALAAVIVLAYHFLPATFVR